MNYLVHLLLASLLVHGVSSFAASTLVKPVESSLRAPLAGATTTTDEGGEDEDMLIDYSTSPPGGRALEVAGILGGRILSPLTASLLQEGFPSDWETFWAQGSPMTNGQRIAAAAEQLGPTYVKFCQALASRPDVIPVSLASALEVLQDDMKPFSTDTARSIIRSELESLMKKEELESFLESLGEEPVAAASIGQVYKGDLPGYGQVAVKVKRRGIREMVERDESLLTTIASSLESIPAFPSVSNGGTNRLIATELVEAVEEFFSRIFEELDYRNEAKNCADFGKLYAADGESTVQVVVPEIIQQLCTDNVLVMEWLEGTKLTDVDEGDASTLKENIGIISIGIECTLSQLLDTGRLHADPHAGNLIKVKTPEGCQLGYLDFGLVSYVPAQVRDALVCAVCYLVFAKDVDAVASLFGELRLLPEEIMNDPVDRAALTAAMEVTLDEALVYESRDGDDSTQIPTLKFDKLLDALSRLVPRFRFQLPPYFINNARALSTLEGIARTLDPSFNVFQVMYPFALNRLLTNPTKSAVVDKTLQNLIRDPLTRRVDARKLRQLLEDSALITGYSRARVLYDVLKTSGGRKLARGVIKEKVLRNPFSREQKLMPSSTSISVSRFLRL